LDRDQPDLAATRPVGRYHIDAKCTGFFKGFYQLSYQSSLRGRDHEGLWIIGFHRDTDMFETVWLDSFHRGGGIMFSRGKGEAQGFNVRGSYPAGEQTGTWRTHWKFSDDALTIQNYTVSPDDKEDKAWELLLSSRLPDSV